MRRDSFITIQSPSTEQSADGQPLTTWTTFDTDWAEIRHQGGLETIKGGAVTSIVKASIRLRYRVDITSGMRVTHETVVYAIEAALPDIATKDHLDLVCEVVR